jgi:hypothetical protein
MIRPAYWTDADLHTRLSADVREFYIGLWMLADDAGYVDWDPVRIGADLYPYRGLAWRSRNIPRWIEALGPHVRMLDCGRHLLVPNLEKHQNPPRPSYPNRRAHEKCARRAVAPDPMWGHVGPSAGREGKGLGLDGGALPRADDNNTETEFQRLVPLAAALGGKTA